MNKYVKPNSVTWWASVVPLVAGLVAAFAPAMGLPDLRDAIQSASGMTPALMVNAGLVGIGLRGAMADKT